MALTQAIASYCAVMSALAVLFALLLRARLTWGRYVILGLLLASAAYIVAGALADGLRFRMLRLLSYGVFGAGPAYLLLCAWFARRENRILTQASLAGVLLVAVVAADCFWVEPYWLEVTRREIATDKLEEPLRIAVIADFQTDVFGDYERDSLRAVLDAQPDMILMAGDYIHAPGSQWPALRDQLNSYLHEIDFRAPLGVFAVGGNTDAVRWPEIFEGLPVHVIEDTGIVQIDGIAVTGLSSQQSFRRKTVVDPQEAFHIVLGHSPNFALGDISADLLVAGHVHGGQVRIPFFGPPITMASVPRSWAVGLTKLSGSRTLVVSRGIGMERLEAPRLRFLCRPELMLLDLVPKEP